MKLRLLGLAIAGAALGLSMGAANAGLIILPNQGAPGQEADPETQSNHPAAPGFPCGAVGCSGVTTVGYQHNAALVAVHPGLYRFTFYGSGNSSDTNRFDLTGSSNPVPPGLVSSFISNNAATTPLFDVLELNVLAANTVIPFTFTNQTTGCSVSNGGTPTTTEGCHYIVALDNSPSAPGTTNPAQTRAWIGFSDRPEADKDFQDLTVLVEQVPVPATVALLGVGLLGLGFARRRHSA